MCVTCSLRSTGVTPLPHYYEAVRPGPMHRYFRPRGCSHLCPFPYPHRPGSQVPYESLDTRPFQCWTSTGRPIRTLEVEDDSSNCWNPNRRRVRAAVRADLLGCGEADRQATSVESGDAIPP